MRVLVLYWALLGLSQPVAATETTPIRIGLTSVFLDDQTSFISAWRDYLESHLQRKVVFIQRANYREVMTLMRSGKLDFAWVCGYPYVRNKQYVNLLAVPVYKGKPTYRSYLIVPSSDVQTKSIGDLRDKVFAFSDPDSNSGYLVPVHELVGIQENAAAFFGKTFFTWSHRKVVEAVAAGVAQAGAVDGYVWDMLAQQHPDLTAQTRVVHESAEFAFPPFVSGKAVAQADVSAMRSALMTMPRDAAGKVLLRKLGLDGFIEGNDRMYSSIAKMMHVIAEK
ncbi:PhnD/SsuA/transferrin family substrate-binding protein [Herbaspirillum sp. ST 5-3]|uniref:PhnD/SsuA/transferrin family substrate-binding protein n=1 Tax=Oxalobacteraceae TaxID=75682 RepID=UPI0010A56E63|nr:PhnD/SsuA/transferrin family substrate-binding protein [Herbaspirillum sp. ST 5-3]